MASFSTIVAQVLAEVHSSVEAISWEAAERLVEQISRAPRLFVTGQGRTGLMARAFAARMAQLGRTVYVVGETTTPAIRRNDLLLACSGSGTTATTCYHAERARAEGATVVAITARPQSRLAELAALTLTVPVAASQQLGNARFEQALLLTLDALAVAVAQKLDIPPAAVWEHHSNLE